MKTNSLKENWFRIALLIFAVALIALIAYYLFVFQPGLAVKERAANLQQEQLSQYREECQAEEAQNEAGNSAVWDKVIASCNQTEDPLACVKSFARQQDNALAPTGQSFINECVASKEGTGTTSNPLLKGTSPGGP